jgi:hypothetical protein
LYWKKVCQQSNTVFYVSKTRREEFDAMLGRHKTMLFYSVMAINLASAYCWFVSSSKHTPVRAAAAAAAESRLFHSSRDSTTTVTTTTPTITEIIGSGRIGSLFAQAGNCRVLGRNDSIDPQKNNDGPIIIATRNDALDDIIEKCPEHRRKDLVFVQNGYLEDFLASKGLDDDDDTTQVLLYLSVPALNAPAIDGVTSYNPQGLTAATGLHAQAFADRLAALNLKCNVVTPEQYRPAMFEKLIWISTYMLVGTAKGCQSVGLAGQDYKDVVEQVITELVAAVSAKENIAFEDGTIPRLAAYTDVVFDFPCAVKEFEWRNQYFYNLGDKACPTHNALLRECAEAGKLGFELP